MVLVSSVAYIAWFNKSKSFTLHSMNYLLLWILYIAVFDWQNYTLYAVIKTVSKFITNATLLVPVLYFYILTST